MPLPKFKLMESEKDIELGYKYLILYEDDNLYSGSFYRGANDNHLYFLTNSNSSTTKRVFLYYKIREIYKIIE